MGANNIKIFGPNLVCCCIDSYESGDLRGRLFCSNRREPLLFSDIHQVLLGMDDYFDEIRFPMASTAARSFSGKKPPLPSDRKEQKLAYDRNVINHKGIKATFIILVQYRQNATWQGRVVWADRNETQNFRSALEMLRIIDDAFKEETKIEN